MLRLLFKALLAYAFCATLYAASPFYAAWALREAVTQGDSAVLEHHVEWSSVRESMRASMLLTALDLPDPDMVSVTAAVEPAPRRGVFHRLKQRVKAYAGRRIVDSMVDRYINAEGLPRLYRARMTEKTVIEGAHGDPADSWERFKSVWARIRKAEFETLTRFAIELEDQFGSGQRYAAKLELRDAGWILTELRIRPVNEAALADRRAQ